MSPKTVERNMRGFGKLVEKSRPISRVVASKTPKASDAGKIRVAKHSLPIMDKKKRT